VNLPDLLDRGVVGIGGCGHVGLRFALAFADRGAGVPICDLSGIAVVLVNPGRMPFTEVGADDLLDAGLLVESADAAIVGTADLLVVTGTPVDEHLNPDLDKAAAEIWDVLGHGVRI
jgi:UDP-N-acetyl-D-mannosaminuronic acid dehydrogenase